ncbi:hypothetical protein Pfo_028000 [Paulownia fortunei]|nr:hypothetical protein Pfo_028000 [Paulownia fortunei]
MEKQAVIPSQTPTTFIQADATTFKDLVQKLTGAPSGSAHKLRPKATVSRRSPFKLQERRMHSVRDLEIIKLAMKSTGNSPGKTRSNALSSPVKGPTTPLGCDSEERAIAEKGFYLHASPQKAEPPVLLTLFPLTSPSPKHEC